MLLRVLTLLFILPLAGVILTAQSDSIVLKPDLLTFQEVETNKSLFDNQKIVSASKTLKDVADLPFTIQIITKEEILNNGYTTLVDVLKMSPGIRVSQPGSALEGETFLMRGLKGNAYTKILINGSPIKPFGVIGMPIGAQLPIRQAERIEIIYGPAAALYGADASAGVINIIIEETNRPLYTQANLAIGSFGYTNVGVTFGGKLGRDNKIANFNFYGSATQVNTRNIIFDKDDLYNPDIYSIRNLYDEVPNFRADSSGIVINDLPHESRMIGVGLSYKMLRFKAEIMERKDHSALGLNPSAVSYFNPGSRIGERIINTEISLGKTFERFGFESKLGFIDYKMDSRSSYNFVTNTLFEVTDSLNSFLASDPINQEFDQALYDSLTLSVFNQYFSGGRYSHARSTDIHLDQTFNIFFNEHFEFTFGGQINFIGSTPQVNFSAVPLRSNLLGDNINYKPQNVPFQPKRRYLWEANAFAQAYLTLDKFNFIGGSQFYKHQIFGRSVNPRLAVIYKANKKLSIRAFYGKAFRTPIPFYATNSYIINPATEIPINLLSLDSLKNFEPEKTSSYELGLRWSPNRNISSDVVFFITETKNFVFSNTTINNRPNNPPVFFLGYSNFSNAKSRLIGIQSSFVFLNLLPGNQLNIHFNFTYSEGSGTIASVLQVQDRIREVPVVIAKARLSYQPFDRLSFTTDHIYMSGTNNGNSFIEFPLPQALKGFYTMDLLIRYELNRNFIIYLKLNNLLNEKYAGLNATNTPDDLLYNAQELRVFRLGMNYKMY